MHKVKNALTNQKHKIEQDRQRRQQQKRDRAAAQLDHTYNENYPPQAMDTTYQNLRPSTTQSSLEGSQMPPSTRQSGQRDHCEPGSGQSDPQKRGEAMYSVQGKRRPGEIPPYTVRGEYKQQGSGKPIELLANCADQVQPNEDIQQLQNDHDVGTSTALEKNRAEVAMAKSRRQKSIEDAERERDELVTAHQNEAQAWRKEKARLDLDIAENEQFINEQRSKLKSEQDRNASLSRDLNSTTDRLKLAEQALEKSKTEIRDTSNMLQSKQDEADSLRRLLGESVYQVKELEHGLKQKEHKLANLEKEQVDERSQHAKVVAGLRQTIQAMTDDFNERHDALTTTQRQDIHRLEKTHEAQMSRFAQKHKNEVEAYQQNIISVRTEAQKEKQQLVQHYKNEVEASQQKAESIRREAEKARQQQQLTFDEQMTQLMNEHDRTVDEVKADWARDIENAETQRQESQVLHDQQMAQTAEDHRQTLSRKDEELVQMTGNAELKMSRQEKAHAAVLVQKEKDFAAGTIQLREDVQRLNAALLTRDDELYQGELFTTSDLPTRPDDQIRARFSEIEQKVDSLGRLQWKQEPAVWTNQVLRSIRGNRVDRVLKKAVVQDLVWGLLFTHVFCSPFRVFGAEGRLLEEEWNEQCGQDGDSSNEVFSWPRPGAKTERWRYMTLKSCREVLRPPVPSEWDPRMRLRKGFMDNLNDFTSELKKSLERIADLTPAHTQLIEGLPKKAASTWLDFAAHRCRIVIRLKDSAALSMEEKVATVQRAPLELTVIPVVGRYGNFKGTDLDKYKTIEKCAGESIAIPS